MLINSFELNHKSFSKLNIRVYEKQTFKMLENWFSLSGNKLPNTCNMLLVQFFKYFLTCNKLRNQLPVLSF